MATAVINNTNPQARKLQNYIGTFPLARKTNPQSEWDKAIAHGAVTPQEFHAMFEKEIKNNW